MIKVRGEKYPKRVELTWSDGGCYYWSEDGCVRGCKIICDYCKTHLIPALADYKEWPAEEFKKLPEIWKPTVLEIWIMRKVQREA